MKKIILSLIAVSMFFASCKKKDDRVAVDMTLKFYTADAEAGVLPVTMNLKFKSDGSVLLSSIYDEYGKGNALTYEISDKMAASTTLHIYGTLSETLSVDGYKAGTVIDWSGPINRLSYNPEVIGFTLNGKYHFKSY